jgi:hypothetical protein
MLVLPKEELKKIGVWAYGKALKTFMAGSGVVYLTTLDKKGLSVYRLIPNNLKGKAYLRLFNEDKMLELAKNGIADPIDNGDAQYLLCGKRLFV